MLEKNEKFAGIEGPVVVVVMDGIGINDSKVGNAVAAASTPTLDMLAKKYPYTTLKAHGVSVGMPSNADMGNSEVGHNALGAGQVYSQGASLVANAIADKSIFDADSWKEIADNSKIEGNTLHLMGLFSDGNVHSHIDHLKALVLQAKEEGVKVVRIHALIDGRDVPATSGLDYTEPFEAWMLELNDANFDVSIASGGGRQKITMDRYDANWPMVEAGWRTHVLGEGRQFASASAAINAFREEIPGIGDQDLPPFVIAKDGKAVGTIQDNDSVVFFNFRGDRAIEISICFTQKEGFEKFDRVRFPKTVYAGMLQYDGDLKLPERFLVNPPAIKNTLSEWFAKSNIAQWACSETQKFGHVTYFWNGNNSAKFSEELETYVEVPSDTIPFEQRPWMKSAEITDELISALESGKHDFLRVNIANGDMVGHTGHFDAAVIGVEAVDLAVERILKAVKAAKGVALITADHGNADEMFEVDKAGVPKLDINGKPKPKTSHTLNLVPCYLYNGTGTDNLDIGNGDYGLSNIAATVAQLKGFKAHESWDTSILKVK
jgi:2,3-bisphosphoglycerate-independent phosphoglycerate mutase